MLYLLLAAGSRRYALDAPSVVEVVPLVELDPIQGAPPSVRGCFSYRGTPVPVVDVSILSGGGPSPDRMSTRIAVVSCAGGGGAPRLVGLLASSVTETLSLSGTDRAPSVEPFLAVDGEVVPLPSVSSFLPEEVRSLVDGRTGGTA